MFDFMGNLIQGTADGAGIAGMGSAMLDASNVIQLPQTAISGIAGMGLPQVAGATSNVAQTAGQGGGFWNSLYGDGTTSGSPLLAGVSGATNLAGTIGSLGQMGKSSEIADRSLAMAEDAYATDKENQEKRSNLRF